MSVSIRIGAHLLALLNDEWEGKRQQEMDPEDFTSQRIFMYMYMHTKLINSTSKG